MRKAEADDLAAMFLRGVTTEADVARLHRVLAGRFVEGFIYGGVAGLGGALLGYWLAG